MNTENIPYHILQISKLYSLSDIKENIAVGKIEKFEISERISGGIQVGASIISLESIEGEEYDGVWVHLGNDYFKNVGLWPSYVC